MNKIIVSANECNNKVTPYLDQNRGIKAINAFEHLKTYGFLFNSFRLYYDNNILYKVEMDKDTIYIKGIDLEEHMGTQSIFTLDEWIDEEYRTKNITTAEEGVMHITTEAVNILLSIMLYITIKAMNQEIVSVKETKKTYSQTKEKSSRQNKLVDHVYNLDQVIYKYAKHINHCKHNITCEHWEVKGHYRHYKDGKVVYVRPYDKGKNKDVKVKDKMWKL